MVGSIQKPANIILAQRVAAKLQEAEDLSDILEQVRSWPNCRAFYSCHA